MNKKVRVLVTFEILKHDGWRVRHVFELPSWKPCPYIPLSDIAIWMQGMDQVSEGLRCEYLCLCRWLSARVLKLDLVLMQKREHHQRVVVLEGANLLSDWIVVNLCQMRVQALEDTEIKLLASLFQEVEGISIVRGLQAIHEQEWANRSEKIRSSKLPPIEELTIKYLKLLDVLTKS